MDFKDRLASALGCSLEWFDFVLYGFFSPIIASSFFPTSGDALTNLINTFGIFAVGFLARPLGGLLFGFISDRYGRTKILKITPMTLSFFTASIGLIPTYSQIGHLAIILLFCVRFAQGICMGGESSNNIIYLVESSSPKYQYFWGAIGSCGGGLGILLASLFSSIYFVFLHGTHNAWLWRIVFLATFPMGILIYLARRKMQEPITKYTAILDNSSLSTDTKKSIILATGTLCLHATSFYFAFMFMPNFLMTFRHMSIATSMINNTFFLILQLSLIPVFGLLADKVGGNKISITNTVLFLLLAPILYHVITYTTYNNIYQIMILLCLMISINAGVLPTLILCKLTYKNRGLVFSVAFNFAFAIFGGLVPYICLSMVKHYSIGTMLPGYYLVFAALISLISLFFLYFKKVSNGSIENVKNPISSY